MNKEREKGPNDSTAAGDVRIRDQVLKALARHVKELDLNLKVTKGHRRAES